MQMRDKGRYPAEFLENIHFETENKNIKAIQNLQRILINYVPSSFWWKSHIIILEKVYKFAAIRFVLIYVCLDGTF